MQKINDEVQQVMLELQCTESLELLRTRMLCLVQTKRMQGHGCWKASFSVYAMLRLKLAHMKDVYDLWIDMLFAMQKDSF